MTVFLWAALDASTISNLILVCKTTHAWILPILYHSISFTKASQLSSFLSSHDIPDDPIESRFALIENLHIGRTSSNNSDLFYGSSNWPLTIVSRILWLSTSLKRLTILDLDQNKWRLFEHVIPASLEHLTLGPIHGPFHPQDLTRRPQLRSFTSVATYMRDDEVREVVLHPSMRVFRRVIPPFSSLETHAVSQVTCVEEAKTLESLQIVLTGSPENNPSMWRSWLLDVTKDPRVVILERSEDYWRIFSDDYEEYRLGFISEHLLSFIAWSFSNWDQRSKSYRFRW